MKLIIGLGNPGRLYRDSRHNIGFLIIKALAQPYKISFKNESGAFSLSAKARIAGHTVILAMPLTFMNLSGIAAGALVKKYRIDLRNLLVVCDDLDLEFGRIKIKDCGSSGGHRGLGSIIDTLGSQDFCRLRVGIGRPPAGVEAADYVLAPFLKKEREKLECIVEGSRDCCLTWIARGIRESMNKFNTRKES